MMGILHNGMVTYTITTRLVDAIKFSFLEDVILAINIIGNMAIQRVGPTNYTCKRIPQKCDDQRTD